MMSRKQFKEMMNLLGSIEEKLDTLVNFQRTLLPKPRLGKEEKKILKLCDRKNTIAAMVTKTGKTSNNVNVTLNSLRRKGLIRSVKIKNNLVYEKV